MTHEASTAPAARSAFSPPAVRDGDRQTSLAYGPDGPERAGSTGGRRTGTEATPWGSSCSPGCGARRRPSNFDAAPLPRPTRDLPAPPRRRALELHNDSIAPSPPVGGSAAGRVVPAAQATQIVPSAREAAGEKERQ
jgi:hypothetical protein